MSRLNAVLMRSQTVLMVIIVLALLWFTILISPQIYHFPPDPFYFVKQLPLTYWFGITILCLMFIHFICRKIEDSSSRDFLFICIILISTAAYLFGLPSFIYGNPRSLDVYRFSFTIHQMALGNLDSYPNLGPLYTTEFQGTTILFAILEILGDINILLFAKYYPLYSILVLTSAIIIIVRIFSKKPVDFLIAGVAYMCLAWVQEYHLCPQSHGLLLGSFILYLVMSLYLSASSGESNSTKLILLIIFWAAVCISHPLSPIILLISVIILFLLTCIVYLARYHLPIGFWSSECDGAVPVSGFTHLIMFLVVIYLAYLLYSSDFLLSRIISTINCAISNLFEGNTLVVNDRIVESPTISYFICYIIRMVTLASVMVGGMIGLIYTVVRQGMTKNIWLVGSLFFGLGAFGISLIIVGYNTYGSDRSYIFLLIPFSVIVMFVLGTTDRNMKIVQFLFLAFVISQIILFPITKYSSDPYGFISESELGGDSFASNHLHYDIPLSIPYTYTNWEYNLIQLKQQKGGYYIRSFQREDINRIYDGGQILMHVPVEKLTDAE